MDPGLAAVTHITHTLKREDQLRVGDADLLDPETCLL